MTTPPPTTATAATGSVYQQLRGHLHYLRLDAAAEALPAALDHAHTQQLSHTAFLERLLAIEVQATEARRQASRLRFAAFPRPGGWRTSTSTPNLASTASWSRNWPPCGLSTSTPTAC
jgi:DNA replication protein DnaC